MIGKPIDRTTAKMFGLTDEVLDEYYGSNGLYDGDMWARYNAVNNDVDERLMNRVNEKRIT